VSGLLNPIKLKDRTARAVSIFFFFCALFSAIDDSDVCAQSPAQAWPMPSAADTLWDTRFARPGVNTHSTKLQCMVANSKYLYVGGDFTNIGPHRSRGLLRWDGKTWEDLSQGFANKLMGGRRYPVSIFSMALDSAGNLYVAGNFDTAGGAPANGFAKFDGTSWSDYSKDYPHDVYKPKVMAMSGNKLYAVAEHVNGFAAVNDGNGWKELPQLREFATERKRILAERAKRKADEEAASIRRRQEEEAERAKNPKGSMHDEVGIAAPEEMRHDRDELQDPEINPRLEIKELAAMGDHVYVAGWFYRSDSATIMRLSNDRWEPLKGHCARGFQQLYSYHDTLYVMGRYREYPHKRVALSWDGKSWGYFPADSGLNLVRLFHLNGRLMTYGSPSNTRKTDGTYYEWSDNKWHIIPKVGIGGYSNEGFASNGTSIFANLYLADTAYWHGSNLIEQKLDPQDPHRFIVRELENDSTLGLWGGISAMTKYEGKIAVVGNISQAGRTRINEVALWDGQRWKDLGGSQFSARRYEWFAPVTVVARVKSLYIAGYGGSGVGKYGNHVFRWDGSKWDSLSKFGFTIHDQWSGAPGSIAKIEFLKDGLYAAGHFDSVGKKPVSSIAYFDGKSWRSLDGGLYNSTKNAIDGQIYDASVSALFEHHGQLLVGGSFSYAGKTKRVSAKNVAQWDGKQWHAMGDGLPGNVQQILEHDGKIIAGGEFYPNGRNSLPWYSLASWNGKTWDLELSMDSGMGRSFEHMFVADSELYVTRYEQDRRDEASYTWLLKRTPDGWIPINKIMGGPSMYFPDGDKLYANPGMFGGHHISNGFGIMKLPR
jgi:hypothetical protein